MYIFYYIYIHVYIYVCMYLYVFIYIYARREREWQWQRDERGYNAWELVASAGCGKHEKHTHEKSQRRDKVGKG
jgi:hypothetical protein